MPVKLFKKRFGYYALLLFVLMAVACTPKEKKIKLKESFTFTSSRRPYPDGFNVSEFNRALAQESINSGRDSTLAFREKKPSYNTPDFADIEFFPVLSKENLEELTATGYGRYSRNKHTAQVNAIDFDTHFVFLTAHPSPSSSLRGMKSGKYAAYFDDVQMHYNEGKTLHVNYDTSVLGDVNQGIDALMQKWKARVYVLEKRDYDTLKVTLYKKTYTFPLKN